MATILTSRTLDMRDLVHAGFTTADVAAGIVRIKAGDYTGVLTGEFAVGSWGGLYGTLTGYRLSLEGRTLFQVSGIERSASTALGLVGDNDAFAAYCFSGDDVMRGGRNSDYIIGFGGNDTLRGGGGHDKLFGGSDRDRLFGGDGRDLLAGGEDVDRLEGQRGDDTYLVDQKTDRVIEHRGEGSDLVLASASFTLASHVENLTLTGGASISATGNGGRNTLRGNEAANTLRGEGGGDSLSGRGGNDRLIGGSGQDSLSGGTGADVFRFRSAEEAGAGRHADRILDFVRGIDRIDLAAIDADPARAGDQAFRFIGGEAFSGAGGELRWDGDAVRGDIDGDGRADFAIRVATASDLAAGDFML